MKIAPLFAWYDLWVGAFWDGAKRRLFILPIPCCGVVIDFTPRPRTALEMAMDAVKAERRRQIEVEGWDTDHDDEHEDGELLKAAVIYLWHGTDREIALRPSDWLGCKNGVPMGWPWDDVWWKPKDRRSNLIRAGALCLAEKERIHRKCLMPWTAHVQHKLDIVLRELAALPNETGVA